jgi:hypothetical protein
LLFQLSNSSRKNFSESTPRDGRPVDFPS